MDNVLKFTSTMYYQEPIVIDERYRHIVIESGVNSIIYDYASCSREIHVHENAHVHYIMFPESVGSQTINLYVQRHATVEFILVNQHQADIIISSYLLQEYAHVTIKGITILQGSDTSSITTQQIHRAPKTTSTVLIKGAAQDQARIVYNGTITIEKKAAQCNAQQYNKNILLSTKAYAQSMPNLQVLNNNVKCSHGSAVSYLDNEQLFYAHSRGLSEKQAQLMLLRGFFSEIIDELPETMIGLLQNNIAHMLVNETQ